jgi:hypothetical protein
MNKIYGVERAQEQSFTRNGRADPKFYLKVLFLTSKQKSPSLLEITKDSAMNLIDHNDSTKKYLIGRDIRLETIEKLSIRWVSKARATSSVFGKDAVSPDGLIIFPLTTTEAKFFGKNFYLCVESEQEHLTLFNESRKRRGEEPESKVPKYLNSKGDRNKDHLVYDPYALLNQDLAELPEPLFATEDTIGVVKAAQDGHRILSSFGVWLVTNKHLEELKNDPDWEHPLKGKFPLYLADSDCFEKVGVFHALVRAYSEVVGGINLSLMNEGK